MLCLFIILIHYNPFINSTKTTKDKSKIKKRKKKKGGGNVSYYLTLNN